MNTSLLCIALIAAAAEPPAAQAMDSLPVGERLEYRVKFTWMSAGTSTMGVYAVEDLDGLALQKIQMRTVSRGMARRLVRVDDVATSWVDPGTCAMVRYRYESNQDDKHKVETFVAEAAALAVEYHKKDSKGRERSVSIARAGNGPVLDTLSMFYYLRRVPIELGRPIEFTVYQGDKAYPLKLSPRSLESVRVAGMGTFKAFKITPESASPGLFSPSGEATFWLEEKTHVLLRMVLDLRVGSSGMYLMTATNSPLLGAPGGPQHGKK
jgi:hypothetical protein